MLEKKMVLRNTSMLKVFIFSGMLFSSTWPSTAVSTNIPCSPRDGDQGLGKICVCNSTYCDTIERPTRLPHGQYYLYSTSNSTPGFSQTTGNFSAYTVSNDDEVVFTIDTTTRFQEIIGFGGSFSDAVGIVLNSLPKDAQDKLIESYFGPSGLEYSLGRVPIGGSDFSTHIYTLDDVPGDINLTYFGLSEEDYKYKIPVIKRAINAGSRPFKLYACAWNAPNWMKENNFYLSGYVINKYLDAWAKYHVKFLEAYKRNGLDVWAFSVSNEAVLPLFLSFFNGSMYGIVSWALNERYWIKNFLLPSLKASNVSDIKLIALDDQRLFAHYWMDRMSFDPEVYDLINGVGVHWYGDFASSPKILEDLHQSFPDKLIIYTETSINPELFGGGPVELGSWERAEIYTYNIIENVNHMANGYIDWNIALNTSGGPGVFLKLDAPVIVNATSGEFYKQPMFYALGHFSKFIPPGSRRVNVTSNQNSTSSGHSQSYNVQQRSKRIPSGLLPMVHTPSVVLCLATANSDESYTAIVFNSKNVTVRVKVEDPQVGSISLDLEAHSIHTFVYWLQSEN